jgi:membrane-bound serine protease (ClpP class)
VDLANEGADGEAAGALLGDLAGARGRNADMARRMATQGTRVVVVPDADVEQSTRALTADGDPDAGEAAVVVVGQTAAVEQGLVDVVAGSLSDVLLEVAGREVGIRAPGGATTPVVLDLDPATASVRFNNPGLLRRMLHTVATPSLAYLLVVAGALCMLFEVFQPGFGVAGATGLVLFGFGIYGFAMLPTSWIGVAVLLVGLALLAVDLAVAGLGFVTAAGAAAVGGGSWLLFAGSQHLSVPWWLLVLVTLAVVAFFVVVMTVVLRAQGNQALAGAENLVGRVGVVRSMLNPEGHVFIAGALWRARAPEQAGRVKSGTRVRVVRLDDTLTLEVEPVEAEAPVS